MKAKTLLFLYLHCLITFLGYIFPSLTYFNRVYLFNLRPSTSTTKKVLITVFLV